MTTSLTQLLQILNQPENPGFAQAAARLDDVLASFNPATLTPTERLTLPALIEQALTNISHAKALTEQQLNQTRQNAQALNSYNRLK